MQFLNKFTLFLKTYVSNKTMRLSRKIILPLHYTFYERVPFIKATNKYKKKPKINLSLVFNNTEYIPTRLSLKERQPIKSPQFDNILKRKRIFYVKNRAKHITFQTKLKKRFLNIIPHVYLKPKPLGLLYDPIIKCAERIIIDFDILEYISTKGLQTPVINITNDMKEDIYLNLYNCNNTEATSLVIKYGLKTIYEKSDILIKHSSINIYVSKLKGSLDSLLKEISYMKC